MSWLNISPNVFTCYILHSISFARLSTVIVFGTRQLSLETKFRVECAKVPHVFLSVTRITAIPMFIMLTHDFSCRTVMTWLNIIKFRENDADFHNTLSQKYVVLRTYLTKWFYVSLTPIFILYSQSFVLTVLSVITHQKQSMFFCS
jgi:hypothetical protein